MPGSTTGSLTATGQVTLTQKQDQDTLVQVMIGGDYATAVFKLQGSLDDGTTYVDLAVIDASTMGILTGSITATSGNKSYNVYAPGYYPVRLNLSSISSGTLEVTMQSASYVGATLVPAGNPGAQTVTAASLANGAVTDNLAFPIVLSTVTTGDVVTAFTPGYSGKITAMSFLVNEKVTTASKNASFNAEIGTTNVSGGIVTVNSTNAATLGVVVAGSSITGNNTFGASDTISIEADTVAAFAEGGGTLYLRIENYSG